mmetsp:Transcript_17834/g.45394  ORF Transcript_17834/g.45394 Transcript_17834/m.45394 type:complete len:388 (+) Transcript_17834:249-1412(+)
MPLLERLSQQLRELSTQLTQLAPKAAVLDGVAVGARVLILLFLAAEHVQSIQVEVHLVRRLAQKGRLARLGALLPGEAVDAVRHLHAAADRGHGAQIQRRIRDRLLVHGRQQPAVLGQVLLTEQCHTAAVRIAAARCAATAVHVHLHGARQLVVHHLVDRGHIDTARSDVGGHQHAAALRTEAIQVAQALALLQLGVQREGRDAQQGEQCDETAQGLDGVHKHQRALVGGRAQQVVQVEVLLLARAHHLVLGDTRRHQTAVAQIHGLHLLAFEGHRLDHLAQRALILLHGRLAHPSLQVHPLTWIHRQRRREKHREPIDVVRLGVVRETTHNMLELGKVTGLQHTVRLVQHQKTCPSTTLYQILFTVVDQLPQTAWSSYYNLRRIAK